MNVRDWIATADKFIDDGDPRGVRACATEIFEIDGNSADGFALLAESELYLGELDGAEIDSRRALEIDPNHLRARLVIGGIAAERFELDVELPTLKAVADEARRLSDHNTLFKALTWLSNGMYLAGDPSGAAECLLEASALKSDRTAELYGKYLFYRNYRQPPSFEVSRHYQLFYNSIVVLDQTGLKQKKYTHKKLRVGYISPDFRRHAVANFIEPLLKLDGDRFQVTCYQTTKGDEVTKRLRRNRVKWRELIDKTSVESARIISRDEIDILIDLSGHTQNSCLPILAYRPAPIQMTAIGYVATTGLEAVDYYLSDAFCAAGDVSGDFTEEILRMPDCHLCYAPTVVSEMPDVNVIPPSVESGHITFGSFNNFAKVSDDVLKLWRLILDGVDGSRLLIKSKTCSVASGRDIIRRRLINVGIDPLRVEFRPFSADYLEQYRDIDIALDTFPYNGGLTTCEALYMGVPVITLLGDYHGSRIAGSILKSAGLDELIAPSADDYVVLATKLAVDIDRLQRYRSVLRRQMLSSPLMDAGRYTQAFGDMLTSIVSRGDR